MSKITHSLLHNSMFSKTKIYFEIITLNNSITEYTIYDVA